MITSGAYLWGLPLILSWPISPTQVESSPPNQNNDDSPAAALPVKRKSNVVLLEEDLELAQVDSQSTTTAKCSQAERKQFMSAFKQPSLDGA